MLAAVCLLALILGCGGSSADPTATPDIDATVQGAIKATADASDAFQTQVAGAVQATREAEATSTPDTVPATVTPTPTASPVPTSTAVPGPSWDTAITILGTTGSDFYPPTPREDGALRWYKALFGVDNQADVTVALNVRLEVFGPDGESLGEEVGQPISVPPAAQSAFNREFDLPSAPVGGSCILTLSANQFEPESSRTTTAQIERTGSWPNVPEAPEAVTGGIDVTDFTCVDTRLGAVGPDGQSHSLFASGTMTNRTGSAQLISGVIVVLFDANGTEVARSNFLPNYTNFPKDKPLDFSTTIPGSEFDEAASCQVYFDLITGNYPSTGQSTADVQVVLAP